MSTPPNLAAHPEVDFTLVYDVDARRAKAIADQHDTRVAATWPRSSIPPPSTPSSSRRRPTPMPTTCAAPPPQASRVVREAHRPGLRPGRRRRRATPATRGIAAMVDFNRRFDRDYAELQRVVASGGVGDVASDPDDHPRSVVAAARLHRRLRRPDARPDRALLRPGAVDRRRLDPESVSPPGSRWSSRRLRRVRRRRPVRGHPPLPGGALVQIDSARQIGYGYDERIEVLGSTGMVEARRHRGGAVSRYGAGQVVDDGMHAAGSTGWPTVTAPRSTTSSTRCETADPDRPRPRRGVEGSSRRRGRHPVTHQRPDGAGALSGPGVRHTAHRT